MKKSELKKIEKQLRKLDEQYLELYKEVLHDNEDAIAGAFIIRSNPSDKNNGIAVIAGSVYVLGGILGALMDDTADVNNIVKEAVTYKLKSLLNDED